MKMCIDSVAILRGFLYLEDSLALCEFLPADIALWLIAVVCHSAVSAVQALGHEGRSGGLGI